MRRILDAFKNSVRALRRLLKSEKAFQQEAMLLVLGLPLGWIVSTSWRSFALLICAIVLVMVVEVLNTGIEAACDALSRDFNIEIQFAKDCGSLAVLMTIFIALAIWALAVVERIWAVSL